MENKAQESLSTVKKPSLLISLLPFVVLIVFMLAGVIIFEVEAHIPLIGASIFTALLGAYLGHSWEDMEQAMIDSNAMVMQANFIILIVGMLVGVWIAGGIVPGLIYYGLNLFTPNMFLLLLPIMCAIIAVSTGSSWTTVGTMGVAAMGIGAALGINPAITAGAVATGASFGDKLSPLSDSTNLSAAVTGTDLFDHVRHMLWSTVPSFTIAVILFGLIGSRYSSDMTDVDTITGVVETLGATFVINPLIFIAPLSVILMIVFKIPAIPGMIGGTIVGMGFSLFQGQGLKDTLYALMYGFESSTGNELVDSLLNRGGMESMLEVTALVICAMAFGGLIQKIGVIDTILETILKKVKTRGGIMAANVVSCIAMNFMAADQYMAIVVPGQMFGPVYKQLNLDSRNLSRLLEDAGTLTSNLVPWSTCGAMYYATLGISAWQYAPYNFIGLINPLIAILYGYTGWTLTRLDPSKPIKSRIDE